jgi:uncharacterized protein
MSAKTKKSPRKTATPASIVWFEIPADDVARAKKFYSQLFGWKINPFPGAPVPDYNYIDTGGADASPDGAVMARMHPEHTITNYVLVPSITRAAARVKKLGGTISKAKTAVPGMGYFVICRDTEKNEFALWERNEKAK